MEWRRLSFVTLLLFFSSQTQAATRTLQVTGTILASAGAPVAGATAEIRPILPGHQAGLQVLDGKPEPPPVAQVRTDASGSFALNAPESGVYRVVLRAPGLVPLELAPLALVDKLDLDRVELPQDAGLTVRVLDSESRPLPGIWIFATPEKAGGGAAQVESGWRPAPRKSLTGPDGTARLPRLPGERLSVSAFAPGFAEVVRGGVEADLTFRLGPGERGRETALHVLDTAGRPVADTLLRVGPLAWPAGKTDADGRVRFRAGNGTPTLLRLTTADGRGATSELPGGATEAEIRLPVEPFLLGGRVHETESRAPLAGALVWSPAEPGRFERTGQDGSYRLIAPEAGPFPLRAAAAGHLTAATRVGEPEIHARLLPPLALRPAIELQGIVVNLKGEPLAGALLDARGVQNGGEARPERRRSRADGRFELRRLAGGGLYEVRATQPGFLPASVRVAAPRTARPLPPLRLVLTPSRPATGTVVDADGRPLAGVRVRLRRFPGAGQLEREPFHLAKPGERGLQEVTTDAQGRFAFAEPPAAEVDLLAFRQGFAPTLQRRRQMPSGQGPWDLGKVVLRPGVALSGRVVDAAGKPVSGAEIHRVDTARPAEILEPALRDKEPAAKTGPDGRFTLGDLTAGKPVHLFATAEGYLPATSQGLRPPGAAPVIRLRPGARMTGRVLTAGGEPVAGARVRLAWHATVAGLTTGPALHRRATTGGDGRFEIRDSPAGDVQVSATAPGFVEGPPLDWVVPSPPGRELEIRLDRGAVVEGQVRTTDGAPVAGARIAVANAASRSDADGLYRVTGAPSGSVRVDLFHPHYRRIQREVTLEPGTNPLDFELTAGKRVAGRVVDSDGAPVAAAKVTVEIPQPSRFYRNYETFSSLDGRFEIASVAPGSYRVEAEAEGYAPALGRTLAVGEAEVPEMEVVLGRGGAVVGQILGLDLEQLARVEVMADDDRIGRHGAVDATGRFAIRDLPEGNWELTARLTAEQREVKARAVIAAGETVERNLEFTNRLTLTGYVEYDGEPLPEAQVSVRSSHLTLERSVSTAFDGSFRIEDLEPDTYWLGVKHSRELLTHNETLEIAGDREVVIRLQAGSLSGKVADAATGKPVAARVQLHPAEGTDFLVAGSADATGRFHLPRVPAGAYKMTVTADGYSPAEKAVEVPGGGAGAEVEVALDAAAGLTLQVRLASGAVPAWIDVRAESLAAGAPPVAERRPVPQGGQVHLATLPAGTWKLLLQAAGGGLVQLTATVPGPPAEVVFPNAAPLRIQVATLAESNLVGVARLTDSAGTVLTILGLTGQIQTQEPVIAGQATVPTVPAGVWNVQVETPDGRRWNAVAATDGHHEAQVRME